MLVVTLITIEVGCTSFSWLSELRHLGGEAIHVINNCIETKLHKQSSKLIKLLLHEAAFAKHLGGSAGRAGACNRSSAGLGLDRGGS